MSKYPLVSVIIPVYNVELYIERCLLSVLDQTYQNIEILLIDDCGQDNSMAVAIQTIKNHPNGHKVQILENKQNKGLSLTRNRGIDSSNGDYLYFLDSDDEITPDCINSLVSSCDGDDIVVGSFLFENSKPNINKRYMQRKDLLDAFLKEDIPLFACNKLIKKDFIINNDLYFIPNMLHEDFIWTYQTINKASSINLISDFTYIYTLRNDSITRAVSKKNIDDLIKSLNYIEQDISKKGINIHVVTFFIKNVWNIKYQATEALTYKDYKKLEFNNMNFPTAGLGRSWKSKYYILRSPLRFQYLLFRLQQFLK